MEKPIGVFDSGIGGLTVLKQLMTYLPLENFVYYADSKNAPYGHRTVAEIIELSDNAIKFLLSKSAKLIVMACNTATAAAVNEMRSKYDVPIVGLEPAIKPACLKTKTGHVGVLATEGTFRGNHFKNTSEKYKEYVKLHLQVAKGLVEFAEKGVFSGDEVKELVFKYIKPLIDENVDYLVLGCTHYPFFYKIINEIVDNKVVIVDSAEPVARRTKDLLMIDRILLTENSLPTLKIFSSGNLEILNKIVFAELNIGNNKHNVEIKII